jgi:ketosteroid isomerase-like protein
MNEQENTKVVQKVYELFRKGDESFLKSFSDDISWELPEMKNVPYAGKFNGIEAVTDFFTRLGEAEESLIHNPTEFIAKDDKVIVLGNMKWRIKDTNNEYDSDFVHVLTVKDGKINGFREFMDTAVRTNAHNAAQAA